MNIVKNDNVIMIDVDETLVVFNYSDEEEKNAIIF